MEKYIPHLLAACWAFGLYWVVFALSKLFRPTKRSKPAKRELSQGGGEPWIRFAARYQVLMAISALFFLGGLVLYPVAIVFKEWVEKGYGLVAFFELALFLGILACALGYVWKKGDLSWLRSKEGSRD